MGIIIMTIELIYQVITTIRGLHLNRESGTVVWLLFHSSLRLMCGQWLTSIHVMASIMTLLSIKIAIIITHRSCQEIVNIILRLMMHLTSISILRHLINLCISKDLLLLSRSSLGASQLLTLGWSLLSLLNCGTQLIDRSLHILYIAILTYQVL